MSDLLFANADLPTQLALAAVWAVFWYLAIDAAGAHVIKPFIARQPWKERWTEQFRRYLNKNFSATFRSDADFIDWAGPFCAAIGQHGLGGALAAPAALGFGGPVAAAMARHGALCEAGWELEDTIQRLWQVGFGGDKGRAKNPPMLFFFFLVHHALGLSMVIPMNIFYGALPAYHQMVFLLQFAAFVAFTAQGYGWTLDVATAAGLWRMRAVSIIVAAVVVWTRLFRFVALARGLLGELYEDGSTIMASAAWPALCGMGLFNALITKDAVLKVIKFARASLPKEQQQQQRLLWPGSVAAERSRPENTACRRRRRSFSLDPSAAGFVKKHSPKLTVVDNMLQR